MRQSSAYQLPSIDCTPNETTIMAHQQQRPNINGRPPVLTSFTMLVFKPMATMAQTINNLLRALKRLKASAGTSKDVATVVIPDANKKKRIEVGNALESLKEPPALASELAFLARISEKTKVIGMMAIVLVNLTVTASSSVALPNPHMLPRLQRMQ